VESTRRARESQSLLRRILRSAGDGVLLLREGRIRYTNAALRAMFGYAKDEMLDASLDAFLPPESLSAVQGALADLAAGRPPPMDFDLKAVRKDGAEILVNLGLSSVKQEGEMVAMAIVREVTDRRRMTAELQSFKNGLDQASDVIVRVDAAGTVAYVNRAVEAHGLAPDRMVGKPFTDFIREQEVASRLRAALDEGRALVFEASMQGANGRKVDARVAATPILGAGGEVQGAMWMVHDVSAFKANQAELIATNKELRRLHSELAESNRRLDLLSRTDELTGIANRRHFDERLQQELARAQRSGQPFSLLLMDLDNFKKLNDTQGHQRGDEALTAIAQVFRKSMRETDMIARSGGDEFVVLLPSTGSVGARTVAEKLRQDLVAANPALGLSDVRVSISVGAATLAPPATATSRELFNLADAAMYRAKAKGGD
ncbi:MAG: diguanylate cyclase, partial [Candidatus Methylomirabilis sp.]|nr:diguanylate cyclase [Deltaproteobacteria bacterium]